MPISRNVGALILDSVDGSFTVHALTGAPAALAGVWTYDAVELTPAYVGAELRNAGYSAPTITVSFAGADGNPISKDGPEILFPVNSGTGSWDAITHLLFQKTTDPTFQFLAAFPEPVIVPSGEALRLPVGTWYGYSTTI